MGKVHKKKQQRNINEPNERLNSTRGILEKIAAEWQRKQAEAVNKNRAKITKPVLEVVDVGSMNIMVTVVWQVSDNSYMYTLCKQHGYLSGKFSKG